MTSMPSRARRFSSAIGDDAVRFGDRILICPRPRHGGRRVDERLHLDFSAGARADLPAPYAEVWVAASRHPERRLIDEGGGHPSSRGADHARDSEGNDLRTQGILHRARGSEGTRLPTRGTDPGHPYILRSTSVYGGRR